MDTDFQSKLAARVAHEQSANHLPSLTVAAAVDGVLLAAASAGFADLKNLVPTSSESCYRIGSITKTFTAALAVLLCRRGTLGLEAPVSRYLPGTPFGHLPLRMLLSHSSGLQREVPVDMWESMQGPSKRELLDAFGHVELVAEPGQRWHYSNLGYAVIGQIIEQVTDQSCETAIEQTFLEPLDLTRTSWTPPTDAVLGYRLDPYTDSAHREPVMDQATAGVGGQMWSTPADLLKWGYALCGGEPAVVPPAVIDAMHTLQIMVDTQTWKRGWGLGLILDRHGDRVLGGHTGAMPGFQSALSIDRRTRTVVAGLTNVTRGISLSDLTTEVALEASAGRAEPPISEWQPAPPCPEYVRDLLGIWWTESDELVLRWGSDGLHAHLASNPATTDTHFIAEGTGRFRAVAGRLQGELLVVTRTQRQVELCWATYPLTRTPR
ncbi:beta-lactamase family protein [Nocardia uniformis]|uniref:Beta-lactamase family protein n=1 Tax=Nocardia uniformis TaxID=53432 RepID=A0A849CBL6_9NOCA|nr:serine hydrolase domain-containing protein [Nocardia uniformis]NNH73740.1 beta-lactamase family protein [Nocardia uniformis]